MRFTPIGWTKRYEFNEADQRSALLSIDQLVDTKFKGRENVDPE